MKHWKLFVKNHVVFKRVVLNAALLSRCDNCRFCCCYLHWRVKDPVRVWSRESGDSYTCYVLGIFEVRNSTNDLGQTFFRKLGPD